MVVKRISDLNILSRNFITAIDGCIDDTFVDEDLCYYTFDQQLYLYLKKEGYDRVFFYNRAPDYGLYSYDKESLNELFKKNEHNNSGRLYAGRRNNDGRPLGESRRLTGNNNENNLATNIIKEGSNLNGQKYYFVNNFKDSSLIDVVLSVLRNTFQKTIFYFSTSVFGVNDVQGFVDGINNIMNEAATIGSMNKLLYIRDSEGFFSREFFAKQADSNKKVFTVGLPDKAECTNWLNSQRIKGAFDSKTIFTFPFDTLTTRICQKKSTLKQLYTELTTDSSLFKNDFINSCRVEEFSEELLSRFLSKIHGQKDNMEVIVKDVTTWVNRPDEYKTPLVLMFAGTSGTGKTYTAEMISEALKSQGYEFVKLPMNEYKDKGDTWKLLGSPVGYEGNNKDTTLVAAHRRSDKLVILFDEMEKAHPSIFDTIMTLMEKGELSNGSGEKFDFRQSIIIFTTNLAMDKLTQRKKELIKTNVEVDSVQFQQAIKDILKQNGVKSEICGRIDSVFVYNTLDANVVARIAIEEIRKLGLVYNLQINNIPEKLLHEIAMQVSGSNEGARPIKKAVAKKMEKTLQSIKKE